MAVDPMTKMWISLAAMGLMFAINLLVIASRKLKTGALRFTFRTLAFMLLLLVFGMIVIVVFL